MATETKKRVLIYKRASFLTKETRTLQAILQEALDNCPKTGQRVQTVGAGADGDEAKRVLNEHRKIGTAIGGVLYRYVPGQHQVVVAPNPDADEWPVSQVLPPHVTGKIKSEFVEGLLYFLVFENHVIVSQSTSLRCGQLEDYLSKFLRDLAKVTNQNEMVLLGEVPSEALRKKGLSKVKAVKFELPLGKMEKEAAQSDSPKRKETFRQVVSRHKLSMLETALKAFGVQIPTAGLTADDAETLELLIELRVAGRRAEDTNALLDQVGNLFANTPDRDYQVEFEDGSKLKGSELMVKTTATVEATGGIPSTNSIWKEMARFLKELHESKKVIG